MKNTERETSFIFVRNIEVVNISSGITFPSALTSRSWCLSFRFCGAFAKLGKPTVTFVMSVCPPVCMEQLGSTGRIFMKFGI